MTKQIRVFTVFLAVMIAVVMLSSSLYIIVESDHDCHGDDCVICEQIAACENTLRVFSIAVTTAALSAVLTFIIVELLPHGMAAFAGRTLVSLKVKLSN